MNGVTFLMNNYLDGFVVAVEKWDLESAKTSGGQWINLKKIGEINISSLSI